MNLIVLFDFFMNLIVLFDLDLSTNSNVGI